jgi:hypothetical protein
VLKGEPPASDELRLAPTVDWIEPALPQQHAHLLTGMDNAAEGDPASLGMIRQLRVF